MMEKKDSRPPLLGIFVLTSIEGRSQLPGSSFGWNYEWPTPSSDDAHPPPLLSRIILETPLSRSFGCIKTSSSSDCSGFRVRIFPPSGPPRPHFERPTAAWTLFLMRRDCRLEWSRRRRVCERHFALLSTHAWTFALHLRGEESDASPHGCAHHTKDWQLFAHLFTGLFAP